MQGTKMKNYVQFRPKDLSRYAHLKAITLEEALVCQA